MSTSAQTNLQEGIDVMTTTKIEDERAESLTTIRTWRERIGAGTDFPLHAPTDVERAMVVKIADLRAQLERLNQQPAGEMVYQYRTRPVDGEWCARWHECSPEYYAGLKNGSHTMPGWEYEPRALRVVEPASMAGSAIAGSQNTTNGAANVERLPVCGVCRRVPCRCQGTGRK